MKKAITLLIILVVMSAGVVNGFDTTLTTYQPSAANSQGCGSMWSSAPTTNLMNVSGMTLSTISVGRGICYFDFSDLPDDITLYNVMFEAKQNLASSGSEVTIYRIDRQDTVWSQLTWNIYKTGSSWESAGCNGVYDYVTTDHEHTAVPGNGNWFSIDCSNITRKAYNDTNKKVWLKLITNAVAPNYDRFVASGSGSVAADRPKLKIWWYRNHPTLTVSKTGGGQGTVTSSPSGIDCGATCSYNFDVDTDVTLTPVAVTGCSFTGWSGACTGSGACVVAMGSPKSVTANFEFTGCPSGSSGDVNVTQLGGTDVTGAQIVDTTNSALKVNVVAGGGSGMQQSDVWGVISLLAGCLMGLCFVASVRVFG